MTTELWSGPGARRSLIFCGAGALVGLTIAGLGLFTAEGTRTRRMPPENAAMVGQVPILMADFVAQLRATDGVSLSAATAVQKRRVLEQMIREELYVQRGVELGLAADDSDVRAALIAATEAQATIDANTAQPADAENRAWWAAHRERYASEGRMTVADYRIPPGMDSARFATALRSGVAAGELGLTLVPTTADGEEFYFAARVHLGKQLFAVARTLRDGEVSALVSTPDGDHILIMAHNVPPVPDRFEDARDQVQRDLTRAKAQALQIATERFLRRRADIRIAPALE